MQVMRQNVQASHTARFEPVYLPRKVLVASTGRHNDPKRARNTTKGATPIPFSRMEKESNGEEERIIRPCTHPKDAEKGEIPVVGRFRRVGSLQERGWKRQEEEQEANEHRKS